MILQRILNKARRPNHTWKRFWNSVLNFLSKSLKTPYVFGLPESILIEPTNLCNLQCPLCPAGSGKMQRPRGTLTLGNFKRIIDEIGDYIYYLLLCNFGEPFLNRDILEMVSYAKQKNIVTSIETNGQLINEAYALGIVQAGLDSVTISLDGTDQNAYEAYRVGGRVSKVIEAITLIRSAKEKKKSRLPLINIQFIPMKYNEHQIGEIKILAKQLRADKLIFKSLCDLHGFPKSLAYMEEYLPLQPQYRLYKLKDGNVVWNTDRADNNFCPMAWTSPAINWDGSLYPCCFDYDNLNMGNVFEWGFRKAWNSKRFLHFRRSIVKDKKNIPACAQCQINFYSETIKNIPLEAEVS